MEILHDLVSLPAAFAQDGIAVAVGNFDGVHIGHRRLLAELLGAARERGLPSVVLTFWPHPRHFFEDPALCPQITSEPKKLALLAETGIDYTIVLPFTRTLALMEADVFAREILVDKLHAKAVIIGENASFGKNKRGDYALLRAMGQGLEPGKRFAVRAIPRLQSNGRTVSSSLIRAMINTGHMVETSQLLGRYHSLDGVVVHGEHRGRELGFPTVNLDPDNDLVPMPAVYAAWVRVQGVHYPAVLSIGSNPTFEDAGIRIEAHILNFAQDIYGERISILLVERLREQFRFPGPLALISQIKLDIQQTKDILEDSILRNAAPEPRR